MGRWWLEKPYRMIQTNLREIDASLDVDTFIASLEAFSANAVLFNTGGIVANYPTCLEFQYRNPYMEGDLVGRVIQAAKEKEIRFIARFDFSKLNETLAARKPEWLYKSVKGESINYNGQVHTCINGFYQQEYSLAILGEVIDRYPVDGIFFNMIGYVTYDYSGNYHGICQCDSCRTLFHERYGHPLPVREDGNDPVFRLYEQFRNETGKALFTKIAAFIKGKNPDIAICTYTHEGVDIYRKESNTGLDRPLPEWNHSGSDNVKSVLHSWDTLTVSNSAVHFIDFPYRHAAVYPQLTLQRLAQSMVNCGWMDYYVIGTLDNQDDRICFEGVKELFRFHGENDHYYSSVESAADTAVIVPSSRSYYGSMKEYRGIYRILAQARIPFDAVDDSTLSTPQAFDKIKKYQVLLLPDVRNLSDECIRLLDRYVAEGGKILATGATSFCDEKGNPADSTRLKSTGIVSGNQCLAKARGTYLRIGSNDKKFMKGFENLDIAYLDGDLYTFDTKESVRKFLSYIPSCMYGPPEKCYYTRETEIPGILLNQHGNGFFAFIPWHLGCHYEKLANHAHEMILMSVLGDLLDYKCSISLESPPLVEITSHRHKTGAWQTISLVNLSGQLGTAFLAGIPIHDVIIRLETGRCPTKVTSLVLKSDLPFTYLNGDIHIMLPTLKLFDTVVVFYDERDKDC